MASIDPRAASPAGAPSLPNPSPTDMARLTQATIQRALSQELSPEDRMIARAAEDKLMLHARRGFWLGTLAGALLALRSRWTAGRSGLRAGQLPRLFFPSSESGAGSFRQQMEAARKAAEEQGQQGHHAGEGHWLRHRWIRLRYPNRRLVGQARSEPDPRAVRSQGGDRGRYAASHRAGGA
ncbi:hypothetical protein AAT19DRAFT_8653 [Rhodotorula toruloides]|uniref:Uncharacterized protein n=1 Tax=Rhodotorula toruloides TaxID=5286 RepID=A0A2T0AHU7_RHOTO|nr:hypothetical protein AAT19DRAFT_8653 [Rhodotorula toruloides]